MQVDGSLIVFFHPQLILEFICYVVDICDLSSEARRSQRVSLCINDIYKVFPQQLNIPLTIIF